jgi:DNA invertase Pin-like site-specific DNA recombinase
MADPPLRKVAQYLRMSTESQNYSLEHQQAAIGAYALARGLSVVRTYTDGGTSGLTLKRRNGLKQLLADVLSGGADYDAILTYDVSRWGRFQDVDESAHYEFICRQAGVQVEYCAEVFENDGSMVATLLKTMKRAMAAEKSRDLSDTVSLAKRRMSLKGYWPGGNPPFGLRRVSEAGGDGKFQVLEAGQANGLKGRRIRIGAGPAEEVEIVGEIFRIFTERPTSVNAVARALNAAKPNSYWGKPWTRQRVRRVLENEIYVGVRVVGRARVHLGERRNQQRSEWVKVPNACAPIVAPAIFRAAQRQLERKRHLTDDEMIERLRALWAKEGHLGQAVIARDPYTPCPGAYALRFGSLAATYARVGYTPTPKQAQLTARIEPYRVRGRPPMRSPLTDDEVIGRLRALRKAAGTIDTELIEITPGLPRMRNLHRRFGSTMRIYELAGHEPNGRQRAGLDRHQGWDARVERGDPSGVASPG